MKPDGRLVFRFPDGSIALAGPGRDLLEGETEEQYWKRLAPLWKTNHPAYAQAELVAVIPGSAHREMDRYFRKAWRWTTQEPVIDVDLDAAREVHREQLRHLRAPLLAALDVEYQRADESKDEQKKADIAKHKQALRDATKDPAIASARTLADIKAAVPEALKGK